MDGLVTFLVFGTAWYWAYPFVGLIHELGHALPALALTREPVGVRIGREPALVHVRLGRLTLNLHPYPGWVGVARWDGEVSRRARIAIMAGGPVASAATIAALVAGAAATGGLAATFLLAAALPTAVQLAVTAIPMRYPSWFGVYAGRESDGAKIRATLRRG